ncbi:hypothetical protein DRO64_03590 [Candidatus Bathyarchaeota archaeon]|nr:MAG: hypothetical protein DRO64_03590 [Candidatus Bathyarchaeota archaeon]
MKNKYSKALRLSDMQYLLDEQEDYENYIERIIAYAKISSTAIKERLSVEERFPMGSYVRGLFGGEKR